MASVSLKKLKIVVFGVLAAMSLSSSMLNAGIETNGSQCGYKVVVEK